MEKVTIKQVEKDVNNSKNRERWMENADDYNPPDLFVYYCQRWFGERLRDNRVPKVIAMSIYAKLCWDLVNEIEEFLGCSHGRSRIAIRTTVDSWNNFVEGHYGKSDG